MSDNSTVKMISAFLKEAPVMMFLSGFFRTPPENFYDSEYVEIDIMRFDEEVAVALADISAGYRGNEADIYTNKRFKAPVFGESTTLNSFDLLKREFGQDPFASPDFQINATRRVMRSTRPLVDKIRRAVELMASQILQTGTSTFTDVNGNVLFTMDFKPKATHFPTAAVTWGTTGDDKLGNLESLADQIRNDGLGSPTTVILGNLAANAFLDDAKVQKFLDNRRMSLGEVRPEVRGQGGKYLGPFSVGDHMLDLWTYEGRYINPQTRVKTRYVAPGSAIMLTEGARMDATFGSIPRIAPPDTRVLPYLPPRVSGSTQGIDYAVNGWLDTTGENLQVGVKSRPALIPTDIDSFGTLNTGL